MPDWERLARAETHHDRLRILEALERGKPMSPKELATLVGLPLGNTAYHVRQLFAAGFLVVDHTIQRRGARQTFYRVAG